MRLAAWIDHVPLWLALGAVAATDVYEPVELGAMALPLLFAACAEWRGWQFGSRRRLLEAATLVGPIGAIWAGIGLVPTLVITLFQLGGVRLALPRGPSQRRQVLLTGFLAWLTTSVTSFEIAFLLWSVLWAAGAGAVLLLHAWEDSARFRGGTFQGAPLRRLPGWTLGTVLLGGILFAALPRLSLGMRSFSWRPAGLASFQAGFSDTLDLQGGGPIAPSGEVVLRVLPGDGRPDTDLGRALTLLKGLTLERLDGQRWSVDPSTPPLRSGILWDGTPPPGPWSSLNLSVAPHPEGILPHPYGRFALVRQPGLPVLAGPGASLRWLFPPRRTVELQLLLAPDPPEPEPSPSGRRRAMLTFTGEGTESAERFGRREAPGDLAPHEVAERLSVALERFAYTVANPSGSAANPLQHFLETSRAGHCEYFASALALMLRHRGIPARVVNGYRLGPWIQEGGYWLVTRNEAHSWVEYYDPEAGGWRTEDPTPAAPPTGFEDGTLWAGLRRWTGTLEFHWDRHVVRFSSEDQMAGLQWLQGGFSTSPGRWPGAQALFVAGAVVASALGLRALLHRRSPIGTDGRDHALKPLAPLLRAAGPALQPASGETLRRWILRLATAHPERAGSLRRLAEEADTVAYGGAAPGGLKTRAQAEAKALRRAGRS